MMAGTKKRLDETLVEKGLCGNLKLAQAYIMSGKVLVDDVKIDKAGHAVDSDSQIRILGEDMQYVSRGGFKLSAAIEHFKIDVNSKTCLDIGASTGGFTDCLLQNGASKVVALDVGKGLIHNKLRQDERVTIIESVNARLLTPDFFKDKFDIITIDVSFISQRLILPAVMPFLKESGFIIALIKPQFEVEKHQVEEGGIVRDDILRKEIVLNMIGFYKSNNLDVFGTMKSPITGADGNVEYLIAAIMR